MTLAPRPVPIIVFLIFDILVMVKSAQAIRFINKYISTK
jgi:hypothetical protein